ncbi:MAG: hypothetical protein QHJ82_15640, partial [Verrucomicrobiota bacterium]|nr:hypothetical protein [Verrucomicrobiota bacterium]
VGRREAFGVRQLAAALFLCPNNVSGTMSRIRGLRRRFAHNRRFSCCERLLFDTNRHGPLPGGMGETELSQST